MKTVDPGTSLALLFVSASACKLKLLLAPTMRAFWLTSAKSLTGEVKE